MARALGAAGRMLWRREDLESGDEVVLDLVAEALARLAPSLRPPHKAAAVEALKQAPCQVQDECRLLLSIALRPSENPLVEMHNTGGQQSDEMEVQEFDADREQQTDISFLEHNMAARVAGCPEEAISIGLEMLASQAVIRHQGCIDKVGGILATAPVEEPEPELMSQDIVEATTMHRYVPCPHQARRIALGTALGLKTRCRLVAVAFLWWKVLLEAEGASACCRKCSAMDTKVDTRLVTKEVKKEVVGKDKGKGIAKGKFKDIVAGDAVSLGPVSAANRHEGFAGSAAVQEGANTMEGAALAAVASFFENVVVISRTGQEH